MAVGGPGKLLSNRPSGKLQRVRFLGIVSSGAVAPSDATIVPSGLNDTKLIQPNLSGCQLTPIFFTNCKAWVSPTELAGTRTTTMMRTAERKFILCARG